MFLCLIVIINYNMSSLFTPQSFSPNKIRMHTYLFDLSCRILWRILNVVFLSVCLDFVSELTRSLEDVLPLLETRVDGPPFECIDEPLSALLFVLEELCHV